MRATLVEHVSLQNVVARCPTKPWPRFTVPGESMTTGTRRRSSAWIYRSDPFHDRVRRLRTHRAARGPGRRACCTQSVESRRTQNEYAKSVAKRKRPFSVTAAARVPSQRGSSALDTFVFRNYKKKAFSACARNLAGIAKLFLPQSADMLLIIFVVSIIKKSFHPFYYTEIHVNNVTSYLFFVSFRVNHSSFIFRVQSTTVWCEFKGNGRRMKNKKTEFIVLD